MSPIGTMDEIDGLAVEAEDADETTSINAIRRLVGAASIISFDLARGDVFWRARRCEPTGFHYEHELGCPPPNASREGRCNDPGEPSLYLSARRETALSEIGAESGEHVHICGFQIHPGTSVRLARIGDLHHVQKRGAMLIGGSRKASQGISSHLNSKKPEEAHRLIYIDAILAGFLADANGAKNDYRIQRSLLGSVYKRDPALDGVLYPSTKDALGLNIAIRSAAANRSIEGCASLVIRVNKPRRHGVFDFEIVRHAIDVNIDGSFLWADHQDPYEIGQYRIRPEEAETIPESL